MAIFTNQATLIYNGGSASSNIAATVTQDGSGAYTATPGLAVLTVAGTI